MCADFKATINTVLKNMAYPLPTVDDLISRLQGSDIFVILDLNQAYLQLQLDEAVKKLFSDKHSLGAICQQSFSVRYHVFAIYFPAFHGHYTVTVPLCTSVFGRCNY